MLVLALALALQQQLSIGDAVKQAHANNPAFQKTLNDVEVAEADVRQRWGGFLPSVSADLRFSGFTSSRVTGENDYGEPVRLPQAIDIKGSSAQQGIGLSMTLFDGGGVLRELNAAKAQVTASNARIQSEALRLQGEVTRQYYRAIRAARLIDVEKQLLKSAQERLERTEALLRVAGSGPVDVLGAQAEVASQEQQVARTQADARKELLVLQELMGAAGDVAYELTSDLPAPFDPNILSVHDLVQRAVSSAPDVLAAQAGTRAADQQASAVRSRRLPSITANAGYGRSMSLSSYDALFEMDPQNRAFNFGVTASMPLFNGFRTSAEVARADATRDDARHDQRQAVLRAERQVRTAHIDVVNAYKLLELAERKAALSRQRLELAQEQYRNGAMSFAELQIVIDRTASAEREVVDARAQYASNLSVLEQYVGGSLTAGR
ncbi:MAG TPA: TolC family protein [Longimicrobiales bacterium]|nr:TolC family protein [Longimicrobiales bacterium]